jgi:hypothetical protein
LRLRRHELTAPERSGSALTLLNIFYLKSELLKRGYDRLCEDFYTDDDHDTLYLVYHYRKYRHWDGKHDYFRTADQITVFRPSKNLYKVICFGDWNRGEPLSNLTDTADYIGKLLRRVRAEQLRRGSALDQ